MADKYTKLDENTLELAREEKIFFKKDELLAQKAEIEALFSKV